MSVHNHLLNRHLDMRLHRVWIAEELQCAVFPLYNLAGKIVGYQRYRPGATRALNNDPREGRYFTRLVNANVGVWGLESWSLSNTLFIVEGIFDAARLTERGYAAIATLSNDISPTTASWLSIVRVSRPVVAVCDNDAAGRKLAKHGNQYHIVEYAKDLGDASDTYVTDFLKEYE